MAETAVAGVLEYHERSKHHLHRYAQGPEGLDWATQPDPFRTFAGAARIDLPLSAEHLTTRYADLYRPVSSNVQPLSLESIGAFFELALGLSAWKQYRQTSWALRCNPSSGNLHPTEGYVVTPALPGIPAGVYHYLSRDHCLEHRCGFDPSGFLPPGTFLVGLSSIHWREAWKYGERAFRYCQHDVGHALASVRYAAAALGWSALLLDDLADDAISTLLGFDDAASFSNVSPADREHPDAIMLIRTNSDGERLSGKLPLAELRAAEWLGKANPLSPHHVDWPAIDAVSEATGKPTTNLLLPDRDDTLPPLAHTSTESAEKLIRQRRSCLALDGTTSIKATDFYAMLDALLPRRGVPPWDALPWTPQIHLALFVNRVVGLTPGLYFFERSTSVHDRLKTAMHDRFLRSRVDGCPNHLRLFLLAPGDYRGVAREISCHQAIAADGAFSLGMIADFGSSICERGAWWYRRLFWEAGMLGQVLYLEAEAGKVRGTGIGCYFDDVCHKQLGLKGDEFKDLYHFTIGGPIDDPRLTTLPAYAHLQR